jgi:hypothetical protein
MLFLKLKNVDGLEFELNVYEIISFALAPKDEVNDIDGRRGFVNAGGTTYHLDHVSAKKIQGIIASNSILHDPTVR